MSLSTLMKSIWLGVLLAVPLLWVVSAGATKGPQNVANTSHNFSTASTNGGFKADGEDEVCIFCHTPHGGNLDGPLWNKPLSDSFFDLKSANYFTHYNSATLSSGAKVGGFTRDLNSESLICMGCHDGTVAVNRVLNVSNRTTPVDVNEPDALIKSITGSEMIMLDDLAGGTGKMIGGSRATLAVFDYSGGHLEDDHPVSFDYTDSYTQKSASLHLISDARTKGLRFFPSGGTGTRLECSSCHDPHVDYNAATQYTPFMITSNEASALCLACHIK